MHARRLRRGGGLAAALALALIAPVLGSPLPTPSATAQSSASPTSREMAADPCVTFPSDDWPIARLAGADRFATAACVAMTGYPDGADTVVLARGDAAGGFADALAGTVLARAEDAPVLLTGPTTLADGARHALQSLAPQTVIVLGGPVAISDQVVQQVRDAGFPVSRVAGDTRAGTAAEIADLVPGDTTFVVNGHRPADALTAGAAAARAGAALLLVETDGIPDATRLALAERTSATIVGGTGVVSADTERAIRATVFADVARLGGPTRFETAATVARTHPGDGVTHLVSGADSNLVDAIAAGWFAALPGGGPVIYTRKESPDRATDRYLRLGALAGAPETRVFGGPHSIAATMVQALEQRYEEAARGGPPDQLRGMWVHLFDDSLKTRGGIEHVLDTAVSGNLNTVIVQGTRRHDAFYDSDVLPSTTDPDLEPGLDVLETLIPAAHARGLQVHVWWSVMPSTHTSMQDENLGPDHINTQHGAAATGTDRWVQTGWTPGYEFLDPAIPGVQAHVASMVREVVERYDVDGVHLDYLRYECLQANSNGTCAAAEPGDDATYNQNPITMQRYAEHGSGRTLGGFLRTQTEDLMRRVMLEVADADPSVVVSGALIAQGEGPTGGDLRSSFERTRTYWNKGQDWRTWLDKGLVDHALPMAYFRESNPTHAQWFDQWAAFADFMDSNRFLTALGQASYLNCVGDSLAQLRQSASTLDGAVVYSYQGDFAEGGDPVTCPGESRGDLFRALSAPDGLFGTPAAVPPVPRRAAPTTGHVLVEVADGDKVWLEPVDEGTQSLPVQADATGHAGFVDIEPGAYYVDTDSGLSEEITVRAGRVTRVR